MDDERKFVILASDGLWHVLSSEEVTKWIDKHLHNGVDLDSIVKGLIYKALNLGSGDNISVTLILLM